MGKGLNRRQAETRFRGERIPKYRKHSSRDFGFVEIDGKRRRLPGRHNSAESVAEYHALVAKMKRHEVTQLDLEPADVERLSVAELAARYLLYCRGHYGDTKRGEYANNADAITHLLGFCGGMLVADFKPKRVKDFQSHLAKTRKKPKKNQRPEDAETLSRKYVNSLVERIRRMFSWGVSEELVDGGQFLAISRVRGLRKGRSEARETKKRKPVPFRYVVPILRYVSPVVRNMLRLQLFTGVRSESVCHAAPEQFDAVKWVWRPKHKTEYLEAEVIVPIGPRCRKLLKPILAAAKPGRPLFSPQTVKPNKRYGERYEPQSYGNAITRAIRRYNKEHGPKEQIPHWSPHLLRHYKGDVVNDKYGIEAAQAVLGHDSMNATKIYRSRRLSLAKKVAEETG